MNKDPHTCKYVCNQVSKRALVTRKTCSKRVSPAPCRHRITSVRGARVRVRACVYAYVYVCVLTRGPRAAAGCSGGCEAASSPAPPADCSPGSHCNTGQGQGQGQGHQGQHPEIRSRKFSKIHLQTYDLLLHPPSDSLQVWVSFGLH